MIANPAKALQYLTLLMLVTSWVVYGLVDHTPSNWVVLMWVSIGLAVMYAATETIHVRRYE